MRSQITKKRASNGNAANFIKIVILLILVGVLLSFGAYKLLKRKASTDLVLNSKITNFEDAVLGAYGAVQENISGFAKNIGKKFRKAFFKKSYKPDEIKGVEISLKHGSVLKGKLSEETKTSYKIITSDNKTLEVDKSRVKKIEYKTQKQLEWPYNSNVVARRTNTIVLDGRIAGLSGDAVTIALGKGGLDGEMELDRKDIEYLIFEPVFNRESDEQEELLREQFPKMTVYKEGNVTIFTDSYITSVNQFKQTIKTAYTEIYLRFFDLFKDKKQERQHFIVMFDDINDYAEYAVTDGVPFWGAAGYFQPAENVLYVFNAFGERVNDMIYKRVVERYGHNIDAIAEEIKSQVDDFHDLAIEGYAEELKEKVYKIYRFYKKELRAQTTETLRHELTHGIFHSWGIQNIIVEAPRQNKKDIAKKKKEFLEAQNTADRERILDQLIKLKKEEYEDSEFLIAQSWLGEGIAQYCETDPLGGALEDRLFDYQEMARKNEVNPIEFLTVFSQGSFPGMNFQAKLNAYAQSWAFTVFLMNKYPDQFIGYMRKLSDGKPKNDEEELSWLLQSLGKTLPELETEFKGFMSQYPPSEDPYVRRYMEWYNLMQ